MRELTLLLLTFLCTSVCAQNIQKETPQNLIKNGGFENYRHKNIKVSGHFGPDDFMYSFPGWSMTTSRSVVCTSAYSGDAVDTTNTICLDGKLKVFEGDVMMELEYTQNCNAPWMKQPGCADNISYELDEPLTIGKVYELSFWLYIQETDTPGYLEHVGASFYSNKLAYHHNSMLSGTDFGLDTIIQNEWYKVNWLVRPTCNLRYVTIGTYRDQNGPPIVYEKSITNSFFIDQVSLTEVEEPENAEDAIVPFCFYEDEDSAATAEVQGATINFASAGYELDSASRAVLNAFAKRLKENKGTIYSISGHTDSIGSGHLELSEQRIDVTLAYLKTAHEIPDLRFLRLPRGATRSIATNTAEAGRSKNRRVEIRQTSGDPVDLIYRKLIDAVDEGDRNTAVKRLLIWTKLAKPEQLLLAYFDPRLSSLLKDPGAQRLFKDRIAEIYPRFAIPNGAYQLDSLWAEDQAPRTLHKWIENLRYYYHDLDAADSLWYIGPLVSKEAVLDHDKANLEVLEAWVKQHGWPKRTVVGARAAKAAPLIILHSGDPLIMEYYLPAAKAACMEGEGDWEYYALLYDRLQVTKGLPQRYGTQYRQNAAGEQELCPEEDPAMTAVWRREIGL